MPRYVVDASAAAKWYFTEDHSENAQRLLDDDSIELLAPDFIYIEVAAVAWKRRCKEEIEEERAMEIVTELADVPFSIDSATALVPSALRIAMQTRRSLYDCLYLALAVRSGAALVTGDRKFFDAIKAGPLSAHISWLGDLP